MTEQANKDIKNKLRIDLLPPSALEGMAQVATFGVTKYGENNWKKGLYISQLIAAAKRHILVFEKGIDRDDESGIHPLYHAMWNLGVAAAEVRDSKHRYTEFDDRDWL